MVSKIAVIGANGKVATHLFQKLTQLKSEFEPTAFIRSSSQGAKFKELGVKYSTDIDLTNSNVKSITESLKGFDAVVFSAGSGGKGLELFFTVDLDGAVKVSEAAKAANVKRFVLVSAIKSLDRDFWWDSELRPYYIAKKYADEVISSDKALDWTILQPGYLLESEGTGKIEEPKKVDAGKKLGDTDNIVIPREDVAQTIIDVLKDDSTIHKFIPLISGSLDIKDAIKKA